jgi:hypothetical protein
MVEIGEHGDLALEAGAGLGERQQLGAHQFDGHATAGAGVGGLVDDTHATAAQASAEHERPEPLR